MADIVFDCPKCTKHLAVDENGSGMRVNCPDCGESILIPQRLLHSAQIMTPTLPNHPSMPSYPPSSIQKTSDAAVWSIVLGILSFIGCCFLLGIPAIICGHVSRSRIKKANSALKGEGIALAGLILGYFSFISSLTFFIIVKAIEQESHIQETKSAFIVLNSGISTYKLLHAGKLPHSLNDIASIATMKQFLKDGFGADMVYMPNHSEGTFTILSPGPDGQIGTSDDISSKDSAFFSP